MSQSTFQVFEQIEMQGSLCLHAIVFGRVDQRLTKQLHPDAIGRDPRRQRIVG